MCLSCVYRVCADEPVFVAKNIAKVSVRDDLIELFDLMGKKTVFYGSILNIDLMENTILIKENAPQ